jgi:uncharacterized membrane protein (UPF0182 family)
MRPRGLTGLIVLAVVLLFAIPSFSIYYTDWLWFQELGYPDIFTKSLNAQGVVFIATFLIAYGFIYGNALIARFGPSEKRLARGAALILSAMLAVSSASNWMMWISFFKAVKFGVADPLLGRKPYTGRLSFSWPKSVAQEPINVGDPGYDPLYAFGWGLRTR